MNKKLLRMASVLLGSAALFAGQAFAESNSILISDAALDSFVPVAETAASEPTDADFAAAAEIVKKSVIIEDQSPQRINDEVEIFDGNRWEHFEEKQD